MAEAPQPPSTPVNVLLVDDQPANLLALEAVLDGPGVHLVKAASGEEALRRLLADDFAVVLLDVQMHGLDGFEGQQVGRLIIDQQDGDFRLRVHGCPQS